MTTPFDKFVAMYSRLPTEVDPDYLELLRMSKYQISDVPMYKPSRCGNCGSSKGDGRKYVDFGLEIDWYGTLFLCGFCLKDVANAMGLFEEWDTKLTEALAEIARLETQQKQEVELPEKLVQAWEEFKAYYVSVQPVSDDVISHSPPSVVSDETPSDQGTDKTEPRLTAPKSRATKSTSVSGSKNVRSLADLLDNDGD